MAAIFPDHLDIGPCARHSVLCYIYQQVFKYTVGLLAVQIKKDFLLRQIVAELDPACLNLIRQLKPHLL